MDWEEEGGNCRGCVGGGSSDEETNEKLSKWRILEAATDKNFSNTTINSNSNSNPTDLSVSSQHQHLRGTTTVTSSSSHQYLHHLHHPFSLTSSNNNNTTSKALELGHIFVSTATSGSSPSSSLSSGSGSAPGINGLNLSPCSTTLDLSITTTTIKTEPGIGGSGSGSVPTTSSSSSSNNRNTSSGVKKSKPIPPPLDLSIGAANLSLNSPSLVTPTPTTLLQSHLSAYSNNFCSSGGSITSSPFYWASSPKFNQAEKSLPLRKRWHSWSPIQMNCSDDPMLPLYTDTHLISIKQERGITNNGDQPVHGLQNGCSNQNGYSNNHSRSNHVTPTNCNHGNSIFNQSAGLQTPTPFYTPNETSPKFMNSPVFSYSTPDTSLYQGPFSPIRTSTLYPPPSSPFMNTSSSLNTPTFTMTPNILTSTSTMTMSGINNANNTSCFNNMVPSTLLSPAPSQASTNSLSYEDLHDKSTSSSTSSLNITLPTPTWNIFMSGTKVRFIGAGSNSMDWYFVDFLAQNGESLGIKAADYAPNGLQVRTLVVPCSIKERIQITFCPIADLHHPAIEVNCESGHPFMVDKKGWCAVKPDAFFETYGTHCQTLEGGDVCLTLAAASARAKSPQQTHQHHQQHQPSQPPPQPQPQQQNHNFNVQVCMVDQGTPPTGTPMCVNMTMTNGVSPPNSLLPTVDEKSVPISVIPQHHTPSQLNNSNSIIHLNNPPLSHKKLSAALGPPSGFVGSGKRANKEANLAQTEQKGRRPMNAFLLFAKDKRPELIQQYPGKDNRSISVLLGEAWQGLAPPEKEKYAANARLRAEEQKKMHPDCWKRKRSQSQPAV